MSAAATSQHLLISRGALGRHTMYLSTPALGGTGCDNEGRRWEHQEPRLALPEPALVSSPQQLRSRLGNERKRGYVSLKRPVQNLSCESSPSQELGIPSNSKNVDIWSLGIIRGPVQNPCRDRGDPLMICPRAPVSPLMPQPSPLRVGAAPPVQSTPNI